MKYVLCLLAIWILSACNSATQPSLSTDTQKQSYAIGLQIGNNFKDQPIKIDVPSMAAGIQDRINGTTPKMNEGEIRKALMDAQSGAQKAAAEEAEKSQKAGQEFLDKNKKEEGWKVTDSGLQYKVIAEGDGAKPKATSKVTVSYTGTLVDGKKFDSSKDHGGTSQFTVGQLIPGWTEALLLMKTGEKVKLAIPPQLAYGTHSPPGIPANSVLLFDMELIKVE